MCHTRFISRAFGHHSFPHGSDSKESTCNVGGLGSIPRLGRSAGEGMATYSSILAWKVPWTEETGGLQSMGVTKSLSDFHFTSVTFEFNLTHSF